MKMLKVGIAGFGIVGKRRKEVISNFNEIKVTCVCDKNFSSSGCLSDGTKFFNNYVDMLNESIDILFVCLPNNLAPKVTISGLKKGLHVFCEKPPGRNVQDIINIREVEKQNSRLKLIFHIRKY